MLGWWCQLTWQGNCWRLNLCCADGDRYSRARATLLSTTLGECVHAARVRGALGNGVAYDWVFDQFEAYQDLN